MVSRCLVFCYNICSRRVNRVSGRQLEILWEFLNSNKSIATAHNRSLQAKEYSRRKWKEVTEILNAQGDGTHKDWAGWTKVTTCDFLFCQYELGLFNILTLI